MPIKSLCYRCGKHTEFIGVKVGFENTDKFDQFLCERCYKRAVKPTLSIKFHIFKTILHNKLVLFNIRKFRPWKHEIFVKWMKFKYAWKWENKKWMFYLKQIKKITPIYWIALFVKQSDIRYELSQCPVEQRQELGEYFLTVFPECFEVQK